MTSLHPTDLDIASPNSLFAARSARLFARRRSPALHGACSPRVVLPAAMLIACCYTLLVLTGVGPRSWQARLCGDGAQSSVCQALPAGRASAATASLDQSQGAL